MEQISISVFIDKQNKHLKLKLDDESLVKDMLNELKINPVTVIISRDNELILEDERLKDKDEIKILSVISGG